MNNHRRYTCAVLLLAATLMLAGCSFLPKENSQQDKAESYLGFSLPNGAVLENENDMLPVVPDGYDYFEIEIPSDDESFSRSISDWPELPYTSDEQSFFFGTEDEYAADHYEIGILPNDGYNYYTAEDGHVYRQGKDGFFDNFIERGEKTVPQEIANGRYSLTVYDEDEDGRYLAFTLCVYDSDASILYIFSYDS